MITYGLMHWERHGRFLDLCDGSDLLASIETRRRRVGVTTYHWVVTRRTGPVMGMTTDIDAAKRAVMAYI